MYATNINFVTVLWRVYPVVEFRKWIVSRWDSEHLLQQLVHRCAHQAWSTVLDSLLADFMLVLDKPNMGAPLVTAAKNVANRMPRNDRKQNVNIIVQDVVAVAVGAL